METRIRPLSSPCLVGFAVFGTSTSGPFRICGAITMKMISSTSTTSTSGVMLMAACILAPSPSRMGILRVEHRCLDVPLHGPPHLDVPLHDLRHLEQTVHELGRSPIHLDVEIFYLACEEIEG